ncbi:choline ABC transporter ATP-binding protein [Vibrio diazotrophicus]|uniref:Glycine betaine/proline transport system ATP-binding protein n=1 Tax=Vibrio diazotrophicus TaxID=685 RepID=A0A329E5C0_VIBDI|nr:choline ABC transporter ATP-binding protein [Vibrio diazotrophicus]RAS59626.1 glycine betaine/proline transport system ATP-binding protein [Vibrio diazotrophicus]
MKTINIENLDVVFGDQTAAATELLDQGKTRQEIIDATGLVVGVDNVSLDVNQGEICVLMGLSGSGKSSLLRAINGLNPITRGSLVVQDKEQSIDLATCNETTLRELRTNKVSMVFQKFALMPWLSVLDNVAFGLEMQGLAKKERRARAREKLEMVGLSEWEEKLPHELSGGMQQRVGLARAFAMDSDILLMDEPFSALDPLIRSQLQDELLSLQKRLNKTIVFVSHDLDEALKIGSRIAIMESGKLIQYGKPEEIVLKPKTQYVQDFVSHTNPLNVLKGRSLMNSCEELKQESGRWQICQQADVWIEKNDSKWNVTSSPKLKLIEWNEQTKFEELTSDSLVVASPDIEMRDAIEIRYHTGNPIVLIENGELVGTLSDHDFYHALLGKYQQEQAA